jgi:hypothetical protein
MIALLIAGTMWMPQDITPSADSLDTVFAKLRGAWSAAGHFTGERIDRYTLEAGGMPIDVEARIRGSDYIVSAELEGMRVLAGRAHGKRWRENSSGTVHVVRADVQGDDFDRWPVAELGFNAGDCTVAGTAIVQRPAWVLADRPPSDIPRWLYVDMKTGDIVREVSREGVRVETYDFSDERGRPGERRAYRWQVQGPGGAETVTLSDSEAASVQPQDVAIPAQGPPVFAAPKGPLRLRASFTPYRGILLPLHFEDEGYSFQLDSGTPELIVAETLSATGPVVFGHASAATIDIDGLTARDAAYLSVPLFEDGLLGFDFFRGRIVHIDYAKRRIDVLPRDTFAPPLDALQLPTDWSEGIPLVAAAVGDATGSRFALDLGSPKLLLTRAFLDRSGAAANVTALGEQPKTVHFLEGPIEYVEGRSGALQLGSQRFEGLTVEVEVANPDNLDVPLDGIIGTDELATSEWWFDADGPLSWFRPNR